MTRILFSVHDDAPLDTLLAGLSELAPLPPFSAQARAFVTDFARRVFALPMLREHPELATLAHWFRPAAQEQLARRVETPGNEYLLARGLVFHLAPANVDVLFAYTWLMSVLAGNRNVARLSQKPSGQREALISILSAMRAEGVHGEVLQRSVLLTYPHDDAVTTLVSRNCQARIIWGGDSTVAKIRSLPLAPLALELAFPDRFGVAAIDAATVAAATDAELDQLAHRFINDVLWFGQQACSSPRTLYWVGSQNTIETALGRFWPKVRSLSHQVEDEPAALMARLTDAHLMAALSPGVHGDSALDSYPLTLGAGRADGELRALQSGHGLVVNVRLDSLAALAPQLDDRDQTLVQHGFTRAALTGLLAQLGNRALDRIVPFGRALDFHPVWDGTDLLDVLTRKITLPGM
ncbi:acyl-CoA reductase [Luteimonas sp BLCC-B24]|uniref:acyl-CoA reductase n=1 Tax=Luteimonas sp. BLCC-B24 TaxID=3025317 RepID=UPI00234C6A5C|nr:acyl-CoA reductase [Luteimonas sp. BLCC-B24]MDC7807945.1 acyl-CoA reductase [Luteimonas sp. BLCC-B24]